MFRSEKVALAARSGKLSKLRVYQGWVDTTLTIAHHLTIAHTLTIDHRPLLTNSVCANLTGQPRREGWATASQGGVGDSAPTPLGRSAEITRGGGGRAGLQKCGSTGRPRAARTVAADSQERGPTDPRERGQIYMSMGRPREAVEALMAAPAGVVEPVGGRRQVLANIKSKCTSPADLAFVETALRSLPPLQD